MHSTLIFKNGYAENFVFALPECFRESINKKKFSIGDVFYSDSCAYETKWITALKSLKVCLQIKEISSDNISFSIMKPNIHKNKLEIQEIRTVTTEEFLTILEFGLKKETQQVD